MKKIESGRSMIEMLGVLAIIGVLSIGGLAAYNTAMTRNDANEVLDYATKAGMYATEKNASGSDYPETEPTTFYGLTQPDDVTAVAYNNATTPTGFTLTLSEDVCGIVTAKTANNAINNVTFTACE